MTIAQDAQNTLRDIRDALNARRLATSDAQEKAELAKEVDAINRKIAALAVNDLRVVSQVVSEAADAVDALVRNAKTRVLDSGLVAKIRSLADAGAKLTGGAVAAAHSIASALPPMVVGSKLPDLSEDYRLCWEACVIRPESSALVAADANRLVKGKERYNRVSARTNVPWQLIGLMHGLECGYDFNKHLHNGDSLDAPTVRVPAGRPPGWTAGSQWEDSAVDALTFKKLEQVTDWSLPRVLFALEAFNGFGYRPKGIRSPYLWSFSNLYEKGKFVADHQFDPNAISKQVGSATLLKRLEEQGLWP